MGTMLKRAVRATALLAVVVVAGCAAPKIPYERATADVKRIGIVTPRFSDSAAVVLASSPAHSFGLIGALVDAGIQATRDSQFNGVLERQKFSAKDQFLSALTATLQARGYEVAIVPVTRQGSDFLDRYPTQAPPKVDAYLDLVSMGYGYVAAGVSTPYRPSFGARARLVSAKGAVLMQDAVFYNAVGPAAPQFVTIAPDPAHSFNSFDDLLANPALAMKGLEVAARQSADTIGKLLQ
jgi:hypothetical protein